MLWDAGNEIVVIDPETLPPPVGSTNPSRANVLLQKIWQSRKLCLSLQRYLLPDPADCMNSACRYKQQTLTVPVSLLIQTAPRSHPVNLWLGAGAWYRHAFSDGLTDSKEGTVAPDLLGYDPTLRTNAYGYHICFGVSIYNVAIEGCSMHGLQPLFDNAYAPDFKPRTYMCNIKWYF